MSAPELPFGGPLPPPPLPAPLPPRVPVPAAAELATDVVEGAYEALAVGVLTPYARTLAKSGRVWDAIDCAREAVAALLRARGGPSEKSLEARLYVVELLLRADRVEDATQEWKHFSDVITTLPPRGFASWLAVGPLHDLGRQAERLGILRLAAPVFTLARDILVAAGKAPSLEPSVRWPWVDPSVAGVRAAVDLVPYSEGDAAGVIKALTPLVEGLRAVSQRHPSPVLADALLRLGLSKAALGDPASAVALLQEARDQVCGVY
jgi:hypothetical protein